MNFWVEKYCASCLPIFVVKNADSYKKIWRLSTKFIEQNVWRGADHRILILPTKIFPHTCSITYLNYRTPILSHTIYNLINTGNTRNIDHVALYNTDHVALNYNTT